MQETLPILEADQGGLTRPEAARVGNVGLVMLLVVFGGYWLLVFNELRVDWSINPQYHYGWVVPLLALGSFRPRWLSRPAAAMARPGTGLWLVAGAVVALLLPIRLAEEANPEWRLVLWVHTLQMVLLTLCAWYYAGGRPWVRHFAFPVCFLLVAVPWPVTLEQFIIQNLMRGIAAVTVETVGLLNIPAIQHGNLIQISTGVVGIDEACSGVRSLQTTIFVSLFLGELYRFTVRRRVILTAASLLLALLGNLGRTTFLVWSAAHKGLEGMRAVHDTAGLAALVATMLALWGLALWMRGRQPLQTAPATLHPGARSLPGPLLIGLAAWLLVVEAGTEMWYRSHETGTVENSRWSVNWPVNQNRFTDIPIDDNVHSILRYSTGRAVGWEDNSGNLWQLFMFRWEPGRNSAQLATAHTPDICLQAAGFQLTSDLGVRYVNAQNLKLPVRQSVFTREGVPLHVFYCLWEDRPAKDNQVAPQEGALSLRGRMLAIVDGRRHLGQQVLEVAIQGPATAAEAAEVFEGEIGQLVQRGDAGQASNVN